MARRCGWRCVPLLPMPRSAVTSKSPRPQPAIRRRSRASRPAVLMPARRLPKAMSATMSAVLPKRRSSSTCSSNAAVRAARVSSAVPNILSTRRCSNPISAILPKPMRCSPAPAPRSIARTRWCCGSIAIFVPCTRSTSGARRRRWPRWISRAPAKSPGSIASASRSAISTCRYRKSSTAPMPGWAA